MSSTTPKTMTTDHHHRVTDSTLMMVMRGVNRNLDYDLDVRGLRHMQAASSSMLFFHSFFGLTSLIIII